jgi:hypothetical protein
MYSRCYVTIVRWAVIADPSLGNGLVNTFLLQRLRMQWGKRYVVYAVRAEKLKREFGQQSVLRVEAGSNASTVTLRVVGGDEKGAQFLGV